MQGASTITQQLVKLLYFNSQRTYSRKFKELLVSILLEFHYTKEQILEMYLNNTPYGGTSWGIQSAAKKFFDKNVWELNLSHKIKNNIFEISKYTKKDVEDCLAALDRKTKITC